MKVNDLCPHGLPKTSEPTRKSVLILNIEGLGRVPSKKNDKKIGMKKNGQRYILQDDDTKEWMEKAINRLVSQLNSAYRTAEAMGTTRCPLCWIASSMPSNDSAKHIRKGAYEIFDAPVGQEGARILVSQYVPMTGHSTKPSEEKSISPFSPRNKANPF